MILHGDSSEIAMKYEGLARATFNDCNKAGDPWGYAKQEHYDNFIPSPTQLGKRTLSTILIKIILDNISNKPIVEKLKDLEERTWNSSDQKEIKKIIEEAIEWTFQCN